MDIGRLSSCPRSNKKYPVFVTTPRQVTRQYLVQTRALRDGIKWHTRLPGFTEEKAALEALDKFKEAVGPGWVHRIKVIETTTYIL